MHGTHGLRETRAVEAAQHQQAMFDIFPESRHLGFDGFGKR